MSDSPIVYQENGITYYRASSLTMCPRAFIYARQGHPRKVPPNLQTAFDAGNEWEPKIVDMLEKRGYEIFDQQRVIDIHLTDTLHIIGHIDGMTQKFRAASIPLSVLEIKALNHENTEKFLADSFENFPAYTAQVTAYLVGTRAEQVIFAIYDKDEAELHEVKLSAEQLAAIPFELWTYANENAWSMYQSNDIMPSCTTGSFCPYYYLHEDELIDDPQLEADCATLTTLKTKSETLSRLREIVSDRIKGRLSESEVKKGRAGSYKFSLSTVRSKRYKTRALDAYLKSQSVFDEYTDQTETKRLTVEKVDE